MLRTTLASTGVGAAADLTAPGSSADVPGTESVGMAAADASAAAVLAPAVDAVADAPAPGAAGVGVAADVVVPSCAETPSSSEAKATSVSAEGSALSTALLAVF